MCRAVLPWEERRVSCRFAMGRKGMSRVVLPRVGDVRRAALLRRPCEGHGRLYFGFVVLSSPSVIGGYVWKLLVKQQLPHKTELTRGRAHLYAEEKTQEAVPLRGVCGYLR